MSLTPSLVLVCIGRHAGSYERLLASRGLAISILSEDQKDLSARFGSRGRDKFSGVRWFGGPETGSPVIDDCLAWMDCEIAERIPCADHMILIGAVRAMHATDRRPLVFCKGRYGRSEFSPDRA